MLAGNRPGPASLSGSGGPQLPQLLAQFDQTVASLAQQYTLDTIAKHPHIAATRQAYKALGASPHEHRNAAEAMLRRVVKQAGLYHINNVVEVNNLISISSGYAIGSYDLDQLQGQVVLACPPAGARYEGIGKGSLSIAHMPVLTDDLGPFGNPSSDSRRAMIQPGLRRWPPSCTPLTVPRGWSPGCRPLRRRCGPTAASPP